MPAPTVTLSTASAEQSGLTASITHTVAAEEDLIVGIATKDEFSKTPSSVVWNTTENLAQVVQSDVSGEENGGGPSVPVTVGAHLWFLEAPTAGTFSVEVTFPGPVAPDFWMFGAASIDGAKDDPLDASAALEENGSINHVYSITTLSENSLAFVQAIPVNDALATIPVADEDPVREEWSVVIDDRDCTAAWKQQALPGLAAMTMQYDAAVTSAGAIAAIAGTPDNGGNGNGEEEEQGIRRPRRGRPTWGRRR